MSTLAEIEAAIAQLPPSQWKEIRLWMDANAPKAETDCCIGAIAIRTRASLATSNRSDFTPMVPHGLVLI